MKYKVKLKLGFNDAMALSTAIEEVVNSVRARELMRTDIDVKQQVYLSAEVRHRLEVRALSWSGAKVMTVGLTMPEAISLVKLTNWGLLTGKGNYERAILQRTFNTLHQATV